MTELEQQKYADILARAEQGMTEIHRKEEEAREYMTGDSWNADNNCVPQHYDFSITPQEYADANMLPFDEGNIVKYVTRHKQKNGAEDIIKAIHYGMFVLKRDYNVESRFLAKDVNSNVKRLEVL